MPSVRQYRPQPVEQVSYDTNSPRKGFGLVQRILTEMDRVLRLVFAPPGSGGTGGTPGSGGTGSGGGGPGAQLATREIIEWIANGPYRADTIVDGAWVVSTDCEVLHLRLWRGVAGTGGSTILDLNRNGSSMYTTQANRPTVTYDDADGVVNCTLPDTVGFAAGDIVTVDTDQRENGRPRDWRLTLEVA